jgi:hypothetical protein
MVAHACNLTYAEGRDQGGQGLRPAQDKREQDPYLSKQARCNSTQLYSQLLPRRHR